MILIDLKNNQISTPIDYRPNLNFDYSYETDGVFDHYAPPPEKDTDDFKPIIDITPEIENLLNNLVFTPDIMRPAIESVLNLVNFMHILIYDKETTKPDEEEIIVEEDKDTVDPNKPVDPNDPDDIFFENIKKPITVEHIYQDKVESIILNYKVSVSDINNYYIETLKNILTEYQLQLFLNAKALSTLPITSKDLKLTMNNKDFNQTLLRSLAKSEIKKDGMMRFFNKLYNAEQGITLLKSLEYSKLTLMKIKDQDQHQTLKTVYLRDLAHENKQLEKKLSEYYKYTESSNLILKDCLELHYQEMVMKHELLQDEEKFKTENAKK